MLTKDDLTEIGKLLEPMNEKLDTHTVSLINLEKEIKAYMDALDVERKRIDKHDDRLEVIEESLDLNP
jgi:DNA repair ATPase RecN